MAIDFSNTAGMKIDFGAILSGLSQKTFDIVIDVNSLSAVYGFLINKDKTASTGWEIAIDNAGKFWFFQCWSGTPGIYVSWSCAGAIASSGLHHIILSYDYGSAANNPILYINNVSKTLVESVNPPSGSAVETAADPVQLGALDSFYPMDCKVIRLNVYDSILSASEIADIYNSRLAIPNIPGIVFAPQLWGCAGGILPGGTIAAGNTIADSISGALGVPAGSPIFRDDQYLTFNN